MLDFKQRGVFSTKKAVSCSNRKSAAEAPLPDKQQEFEPPRNMMLLAPHAGRSMLEILTIGPQGDTPMSRHARISSASPLPGRRRAWLAAIARPARPCRLAG